MLLSASLVFGDANYVNMLEFDMQVLANGTIDSLSFRFAPINTPSVADGIIVLNSPLFIFGTDIASGNTFSDSYRDSAETFTLSAPSVPGLSPPGMVSLFLLVFSLGSWLLANRREQMSRP